jgi:hypothetical protein
MRDTIVTSVKELWRIIPPISRRTRPNLATAIGLVAGGIGLAIYFRTIIDLVVPVAVAIAIQLIVVKEMGSDVQLGWLAGAIIAALYGFLRSQTSNTRIDEQAHGQVDQLQMLGGMK